MRSNYLDLIGKKFGKLTVIELDSIINYQPKLLCKCDCGNNKIVFKSNLIRGLVKSCGCIKTKDTVDNKFPYYTDLYNIWYAIKRRCFCKKDKGYKNYGALGIDMDEKWKNNFMSFYKWSIDNGYKKEKKIKNNLLTIDRINNEKGYYPNNCRWVGYEIQSINRRNNHKLIYENKKLTIKEISTKLNISYMTLYNELTRTNFNIDKSIQKLKEKGKIK